METAKAALEGMNVGAITVLWDRVVWRVGPIGWKVAVDKFGTVNARSGEVSTLDHAAARLCAA